MHHHNIALFVDTYLAVWITNNVFCEVLDFGADAEPDHELRVLRLKVSLHTSTFQNNLHSEATSLLLDIIVDHSGFSRSGVCCTHCHHVSGGWALHVVVGQGTLLPVSIVELGSQTTGNSRVLSEVQFVGLRIEGVFREFDHPCVRLRGGASHEPLDAEVLQCLALVRWNISLVLVREIRESPCVSEVAGSSGNRCPGQQNWCAGAGQQGHGSRKVAQA
mmetsp:Transcript_42733/g.91683  ORF Transcript_42733/g.91683 Transcript_42733/m.91683 type:complete len:219 (-) Transcript_42733:203-859(-)